MRAPRSLPTVPPRLAEGTAFRCERYGTALTVAQCAARWNGRDVGDKCDGCLIGERGSTALRVRVEQKAKSTRAYMRKLAAAGVKP